MSDYLVALFPAAFHAFAFNAMEMSGTFYPNGKSPAWDAFKSPYHLVAVALTIIACSWVLFPLVEGLTHWAVTTFCLVGAALMIWCAFRLVKKK